MLEARTVKSPADVIKKSTLYSYSFYIFLMKRKAEAKINTVINPSQHWAAKVN